MVTTCDNMGSTTNNAFTTKPDDKPLPNNSTMVVHKTYTTLESLVPSTTESDQRARPTNIREWDKYIQFWNDPRNVARAAQNQQNRAKSMVISRQGSRSLARLRDEMFELGGASGSDGCGDDEEGADDQDDEDEDGDGDT
nr:putative CCT domain, CheY-like superfamily [Tanacetum cinerariifolium]